jgi:nicotinamidase-related amidase
MDLPGEKVIAKRTFDAFHNPELQSCLLENKKRFVLTAGLVTSVCVLLTAASAAQRGYLVTMVEDCCGDDPDAHQQTLERYPFIFSRTMVDQIPDKLEEWTVDLERLDLC